MKNMTQDERLDYLVEAFNEAYCPMQIEKQSVCIDGDSAEVIEQLL